MQRKIFFAIRVATFIDFVYKTYLAPLSLWRIRSKLNPSKDPKYYVRVYLKVFLLLSISLIMIKVSESSLICWKKETFTVWKVSKYRVISGPYFPVFGLNTRTYGPEETQYLDTFHVVFYWKNYHWPKLHMQHHTCNILLNLETFAKYLY